MTKEDSLSIRRDRFVPKKRMMEYGQKLALNDDLKSFMKNKKQIVSQINSDKVLNDDSRNKTMELLQYKEDSLRFYEKYKNR